jgi:hypothetical protein
MASDAGLRGLLDITVGLVRSSEGDYERVNVSVWSKIVDVDELAARAEALSRDHREPYRRVAQRFVDALEKGRTNPF